VAVAPLENRSNDLDASEIIRSAFAGEIARRGWNVLSLAESDRVLREALGISYGGHDGPLPRRMHPVERVAVSGAGGR